MVNSLKVSFLLKRNLTKKNGKLLEGTFFIKKKPNQETQTFRYLRKSLHVKERPQNFVISLDLLFLFKVLSE